MGNVRALVLVAIAACGSVKKEDDPADAMQMQPDMAAACTGDTIAGCGSSCAVCSATTERELPTCDGNACGTTCVGSAPRCNDNSCSRVFWDFSSGMPDGVAGRTPVNLAVAVRNFNGEQALAIDLTSLTEVAIRIPVCLSGVVDLQSATLSYRVFFQGGTQQNENYYTQASVPSPQNSAFVGSRAVQAGLWVPFSGLMSMSQFSGTTSEITIQLGTYGAAFAGTIWVDDIEVQ